MSSPHEGARRAKRAFGGESTPGVFSSICERGEKVLVAGMAGALSASPWRRAEVKPPQSRAHPPAGVHIFGAIETAREFSS